MNSTFIDFSNRYNVYKEISILTIRVKINMKKSGVN